MIKPVLQDETFLADVMASRGQGGFRLWWLGQSGFLLQWGKRHLLFDPYLSDSLTRKYAATEKPHVRMTERVVAPERLGFVDVVTSTHNHTDHLDAETLAPLYQEATRSKGILGVGHDLFVVVPEANRAFAADRLGWDAEGFTGLDVGETDTKLGFDITAVPAAHETLERDDQGRMKYLGYVVRFGDWCVYHSGDTMLYDGMVETLRPFNIDVALLPINGRRPERRVAGNLRGREAAWLAKEIGAKVVIPCHYDMFEFNTESPEEFVRECEQLGQRYRVLRAGERFTYP
jgi:L-ascorbate metabolism protein UlaG (beta-lactamase superfamily)